MFLKIFFSKKNSNNTQQIIHILLSWSKCSFCRNSWSLEFGIIWIFFGFYRNVIFWWFLNVQVKKIAFDSSAEMTVIALEKCNFEWDNAVVILRVTILARRDGEKRRRPAAVTSSEIPSRPRLAGPGWFIAVGTGDRVRRPRGPRSDRRTRDFPS